MFVIIRMTRVKWLAFTQPPSRILGQHRVLKSVNSALSPAFGNRYHGSFQFYCATMYLPIETECYSVDHRKSCQRVESWKLSRPSAGRGLPGAGSLHQIHRYRDDRIYDDCAADHVILPSFRW